MSTTSPASSQPRAASARLGPLASWSALGRAGVRQPGGHGRVVVGADVGDVDPRGLALAGRDGDGHDLAGAGTPAALDRHADALAGGRVLLQPRRGLAGREPSAVELEAGLRLEGLGGVGVDRLEQPAAQLAAELQLVEQLEALGAVPRLAGQAVADAPGG